MLNWIILRKRQTRKNVLMNYSTKEINKKKHILLNYSMKEIGKEKHVSLNYSMKEIDKKKDVGWVDPGQTRVEA